MILTRQFVIVLLTIAILLLSTAYVVRAQQTTYLISVHDSTSLEPLAAATFIIQKDGKTIHTGKADEQGRFTLPFTESDAAIAVSYVGYNTKELLISQILQNDGKVYLSPSFSLETVVVQSRRQPVAFKVDRQSYSASQFGSAATGNAIDIIKNLPSVSVDAQGNVSFRGSSSFLLLINGKPTQADPGTILSQLAASSVENIEVITSPSAAYDADGKSGVINIITKGNVEEGWMMQANAMAGAPPVTDFNNIRNPQRYGLGFSAGYKKDKWDISGGVNYLRNDITGFREGNVYTTRDNIKTAFPSTGERSFKRYNGAARLSVNYDVNTNNKLGLGLYVGKKYQSRDALLVYHVSEINTGNNDTIRRFNYYNPNIQEKQGVFSLANLDYEHIFRDASKINFSLLYEGADLSGNIYSPDLHYSNVQDTLQYTYNTNTNPLHAYRIKTDYSKVFNAVTFQTGYQFRYDTQYGNFLYYTKLLGTDQFIPEPEFTSRVLVKNSIHAGYMQVSGKVDALNYTLGARIEATHRSLSFSKNNEEDKLPFTNFFPSAQFRYTLDKSNIKLGYSRRIRRTNNFELNPLPEREHSETLEQGDPYLLPELIGMYELGWEKTLKGGNLFVTLYHQHVKNPIQRVNKVYNDTILNRVFTNAGVALQTGLEANFNKKITLWWQVVLGGNIYRYDIEGKIFNETISVKNSSWVYSINTTQTFTFPRNWSSQLSVNYISERVTAQGEDSRFLTPNLIIKKISGDGRWNFQLSWLNIDLGMQQANRQRITTYGSNFYTTTNYIYEPDQFQLSVGYSLNKRNRKIKLPESEIGEKEF